jgi:hypothetical protein
MSIYFFSSNESARTLVLGPITKPNKLEELLMWHFVRIYREKESEGFVEAYCWLWIGEYSRVLIKLPNNI